MEKAILINSSFSILGKHDLASIQFPTTQNFLTVLSTLVLMAITLLFLLHKYKVTDRERAKQYPLPPGPKPWLLVGNLPEMLKNKPTFRWIHKLMHEMNTEIACIRLGNVHVIPVTSPEISREFLIKQDALFASRPISMSTYLTTKGYLSTVMVPYGDQWKKMRRVLMVLLSPAKHRWLYAKRVEEADHLVRYVNNQCKSSDKGGLVNVRTVSQQYCGNVMRKMVFNKRFFGEGKDDGGPGSEEEEHLHAVFTILSNIYSFSISDYVPCLRGIGFDGNEKIVKKANEIISKYHDPIIDERIQQWTCTGSSKKEPADLLDVLITMKDAHEPGNPLLSSNEIKAQITELMMAAVDNPPNAVEWTIAEMINQPEMLQKAIEELDSVVGKERLVEESDFSQLNYVKACVKEALRLHPLDAFNLPHVSLSDSLVANYFIPKGSHVLLSRYGLGRNSRVWDEPLKFKPERHLQARSDEVVLTESDLRFISFSTGRRGCMGVTLGTSMTLMLLARLLHAFTWKAPPEVSSINLSESEGSLALAKPLVALAKPRLPANLYPY